MRWGTSGSGPTGKVANLIEEGPSLAREVISLDRWIFYLLEEL